MKFTIFTGCYNSAPFIERVFSSIKSQTHKDFEWIVIDDCSKDNTVNLLKRFIAENPDLDIKLFVNEKNQGVDVSRRHAIMLATGELFVIWDHDDVQKLQQLEKFHDIFIHYRSTKIANIFCPCEDPFGKLCGNNFPAAFRIGNYLDYYKDYFIESRGSGSKERHGCVRTEVLREYQNKQDNKGGLLIDGDTLHASIALKYDSIMIDEVLRIYYNDLDNPNNMSSTTRSLGAKKIYFTKLFWVNHIIKKMSRYPLIQLRYIFSLVFYGFLSSKKLSVILKDITNSWGKFFALLMAFPAISALIYIKIRKPDFLCL